jgi:hypothetical protein
MGKAERNRAQSARARIAAQQAAARKAEQRRRVLIDAYSNTATLDFYRSAYTSKYVVFTPIESETVTGAPLQNPTAAQKKLITKYDAAPYVPKTAAGKIPFIDFGGAYVDSGAQYLPSMLGTTPAEDPSHFGLTWAQIAADLRDPSSPVAQNVLGAANRITAAICKLTHGQPGNVCQSAAVTSVSSKI